MYGLIGMAIAVAAAVLAFVQATRGGGVYATELYAMTPRTHRRFAYASLAFAALFGFSLVLPVIQIPALAVYTLLLILYGSSFVRGFSAEDE